MTSNLKKVAGDIEAAIHAADKPDYATRFGSVFLAVMTLGLVPIMDDAMDTTARKNHRMPDDWLAEIAQIPDLSKEGLTFLAKKLDRQGYVSLDDAVHWLEIEHMARAEQRLQSMKDAAREKTGARMLLERADAETGSSWVETVKSIGTGIKDVAEAGVHIVAAKVEVVKTVGSLAKGATKILRDIRS